MIDLSDDQINSIILEILSAEKIINYNFLNFSIVFKHPTCRIKKLAEHYENSLIEKYKLEGYLDETELPEELISTFFSTEDQQELEDLDSKIKGYELLLKKRSKISDQYKKDDEKIQELAARRNTLLNNKNHHKQFTANFKAREDKFIFLLTNCSYTLENNLIWSSNSQFLDYLDDIVKSYSILSDFLAFYMGYPNNILRLIARHPIWKNYYINSVKGIFRLFERKTEDLSADQTNLIAWSGFYSNINEMLPKDRPSDETIEDDDKLDAYIAEYHRKVDAEKDLHRKRDSGNNKALNHQHVVVTAGSEDYVSFHKKQVYSDPKIISGRKEQDSTTYSEKEEFLKVKRRISKK